MICVVYIEAFDVEGAPEEYRALLWKNPIFLPRRGEAIIWMSRIGKKWAGVVNRVEHNLIEQRVTIVVEQIVPY